MKKLIIFIAFIIILFIANQIIQFKQFEYEKKYKLSFAEYDNKIILIETVR